MNIIHKRVITSSRFITLVPYLVLFCIGYQTADTLFHFQFSSNNENNDLIISTNYLPVLHILTQQQQQQQQNDLATRKLTFQQPQQQQRYDDISANGSVRKERRIVFIHIGKAGGETIKDAFEFCCRERTSIVRQKQCRTTLPTDSTLSKLVYGYAHGILPPKPEGILDESSKNYSTNNITSFLINIRHPVDRIISWYDYINPMNCRNTTSTLVTNGTTTIDLGGPTTSCSFLKHINDHTGEQFMLKDFYYMCFPRLELFVQGLNPLSKFITPYCKSLAKIVMEGGTTTRGVAANLSYPFYGHARANYRMYYNRYVRRYRTKEILVVRMEHLWDDMIQLEKYVGGTSTFPTLLSRHYTHGSEYYKKNDTTITTTTRSGRIMPPSRLSFTNMRTICCAMIDEMILYKAILFRATNIDPITKEETWKADIEKCTFPTQELMFELCAAQPKFTDVASNLVVLPTKPPLQLSTILSDRLLRKQQTLTLSNNKRSERQS